MSGSWTTVLAPSLVSDRQRNSDAATAWVHCGESLCGNRRNTSHERIDISQWSAGGLGRRLSNWLGSNLSDRDRHDWHAARQWGRRRATPSLKGAIARVTSRERRLSP